MHVSGDAMPCRQVRSDLCKCKGGRRKHRKVVKPRLDSWNRSVAGMWGAAEMSKVARIECGWIFVMIDEIQLGIRKSSAL